MDNSFLDVKNSATEYIPKLITGIDNLLDGLRTGKLTDLENLADIADGLRWLQSAVISICNAGGKSIPESCNQMQNNISEILESLQNMDFVLLADLLEYEVEPLLNEWKILFNEAAEK